MQNLSEYACQNFQAIYFNGSTDISNPFFHDTGLIINSNSYIRLQNKMQVFPYGGNDHITTRMIHVQLVSKIARTIGRALVLNEDLIEAAALCHDVGHSPFGHEGEEVLNHLSLKYNNNRIFRHSINSVRNLLFLENNGQGLNISLQVLDGAMSHNGEQNTKFLEPKPKTKEEFLQEYYTSYTDKSVLVHLTPMTLEGCVVRISDRFAYIVRDMEDAVRYKIFSWDILPKSITSVLGNNRDEIVNTLVNDVIRMSYNKPYIMQSQEIHEALNELYKFNYIHIYKNDKKLNIDYEINDLKEVIDILSK